MNVIFLMILIFIVYVLYNSSKQKLVSEGYTSTIKKAIAVLTNNESKVEGKVVFEEVDNECKIHAKIKGLKEGKHGIHIHRLGDLSEGCDSLCKHFNPLQKSHGGLNDDEKHIGDLGNITADASGNVDQIINSKEIKLNGHFSIIGRSVIIHEDEDDEGRYDGLDETKKEESKKTGNSGKRVLCGVIGIAE